MKAVPPNCFLSLFTEIKSGYEKVPYDPMIQKGPPAAALRLASFTMMDRSPPFWLREVLAGSANKLCSFSPPLGPLH